jgi:hypothetical protein
MGRGFRDWFLVDAVPKWDWADLFHVEQFRSGKQFPSMFHVEHDKGLASAGSLGG